MITVNHMIKGDRMEWIKISCRNRGGERYFNRDHIQSAWAKTYDEENEKECGCKHRIALGMINDKWEYFDYSADEKQQYMTALKRLNIEGWIE